jgi:hypothetical protein
MRKQLINLLPPEIQSNIYYYTLPVINPNLKNEIINYKRKRIIEIINYNVLRIFNGVGSLNYST